MSYDAEIPHLRICPKKPKTLIQKNACTAIFIAALFTTAKIWKQPKYPPIDEWTKKAVVHLHNGILLGHKVEGNLTHCNSMDGPGQQDTKWNKIVIERQLPYDFTHMWNLMNNRNKQHRDRLIERRLIAVGMEGWKVRGPGGEVEWLSWKEKQREKLIQTTVGWLPEAELG